MVIVETHVFTKRVIEILSEDEYRELQLLLVQNPEAGDVIPGARGLRKLRWRIEGRGKRGGARLIYYWFETKESILMLFLFRKNERADLGRDQLKRLRAVVQKELQ